MTIADIVADVALALHVPLSAVLDMTLPQVQLVLRRSAVATAYEQEVMLTTLCVAIAGSFGSEKAIKSYRAELRRTISGKVRKKKSWQRELIDAAKPFTKPAHGDHNRRNPA